MSRYNKIRWTNSDDKELRRVVKNFNAKIDRLNKKDPSKLLNSLPEGLVPNKNALPEKISVRQLKELINTRQDLNRELNSLRRFCKKGSEELILVPDTKYNLQVTKWQKIDTNRRIVIINKRRQERLELIAETKVQGYNYTLGQLGMGKQAENELRPAKAFFPSMTQTDLKMKRKSVLKESQSDYFNEKDYRLRDNYIKGLRENYSERDIKDIIEHIENMPIKQFLKNFRAVDLNTFEWASGPPSQAEYDGYVNRLRTEWLPEKANTKTINFESELKAFESKKESSVKKAMKDRYLNLFYNGRLLGSYKNYDDVIARMKRYKDKSKFSYNITL